MARNHKSNGTNEWLSKTQPDHEPQQVRSVDELQKGETYLRVIDGKQRVRIQLVNEPQETHGLLYIEFRWITDKGTVLHGVLRAYLQDLGVVSYKTGLWHAHNYLLHTSPTRT